MTEPLTDEELAEIEAWSKRHWILPTERVPRLVADLRASREEHEADRQAATEVMMRQAADLRASRAEVERLREDARENYARAEQAEQALQRFKATP